MTAFRHRRRRPSRPGPTIVIPQIAQPEPNPLLPDPVARPARSPPRSSVPVALEPAPVPVVLSDTTVVLPPRRWALQELRPFEALGVQYGSFLFRPAVELTRGYDTNPARTMPASGSWYSIVAPQLLVNSDWSRHELTATLRGSYTDYDTANQLNRPLVDAKVNSRIDVTALTRIDLEGRYYLGTDSPGSPNIQANLLWYPIYHQLGFTGGLGQRINYLDMSLKGGADRTTYTDSHFDNGQVSSNADRNFNRFFTTGRATYEISPGLRPFSEWTADSRVYDLGVDAGGDNRNSQGISGKFGSAFELTQKLTGEASAGYIRRHYDDPQLPSFGAYLIDASLIFTASALTTLRFTAVTTVSETTLAGVSGVLTREYTGQIDHAFRRWLIGTLRFMRGTDVYVGSPRVDIRYSAAAQLSLHAHARLVGHAPSTATNGATPTSPARTIRPTSISSGCAGSDNSRAPISVHASGQIGLGQRRCEDRRTGIFHGLPGGGRPTPDEPIGDHRDHRQARKRGDPLARMQQCDECERSEQEAKRHIGRPAICEMGLQAEGDADRGGQDQQRTLHLCKARLDDEFGPHEHPGHQSEQGNADLQRSVQRRVERCVGDLRGHCGHQRRRRRQFAEHAKEKCKEVHDPWIDADLDHRRRDHDRDQDVGRRRWQTGSEDGAENEGEHDHGHEIDARRIDQQAAELGRHAGDDERARHDRQRREQQREVRDHLHVGVEKSR